MWPPILTKRFNGNISLGNGPNSVDSNGILLDLQVFIKCLLSEVVATISGLNS